MDLDERVQWLMHTVQEAHKFLESLPHGWLAKTTGDIAALNNFYMAYRAIQVDSNFPSVVLLEDHNDALNDLTHAFSVQTGNMQIAHDKRVAELLAANNAEVERRREAEHKLQELIDAKQS